MNETKNFAMKNKTHVLKYATIAVYSQSQTKKHKKRTGWTLPTTLCIESQSPSVVQAFIKG